MQIEFALDLKSLLCSGARVAEAHLHAGDRQESDFSVLKNFPAQLQMTPIPARKTQLLPLINLH
jgi:hypothetical protein